MGFVLVGEALDKFIGARLLAGILQLLLGGVFVAPAQVVGNGAAEQLVFLQDHRHAVAQGVQVVAAHVLAADVNVTGGGVVQTGQQLHKAGLGAAGAADDAHGFAGADVQRNIAQHIAPVLLIAEADVVKAHRAVLDLRQGLVAVGKGALLGQHLADAAGAGGRHGDHNKDHRQHHQAGQDVHAVGQHGHQLAGGELRRAGQHDHPRAQPGNQQNAGVDGRHHQGRVVGQDFFCLEQKLLHVAGGFFELFALKILAHIRLDHADGGNVFLHALVQVVIFFEGVREVAAGAGHNDDQANA